MQTGKFSGVFGVVLSGTLILGGCATKKHVREAIAPVQQQVNAVQKQASDTQTLASSNKTAIGDLDRQVASVDEKAVDAGKKATQAGEAAAAADAAAKQAAQRAEAANSAAEQAQQGVGKIDKSLQNLDNYRLVDTKQVFFKTNRSTLDMKAKEDLDNAIQALGNMKQYVIEVEGYADRTGSPAYNMELSQKRADNVVRYLTVDHNIPLRDIRVLGVGSVFPNAENKTRADREKNRRVDLKIYALDLSGTGQSGQQSADRSSGGAQ